MFEDERAGGGLDQGGPAVLVRLTADLQERIGVLARIVREKKLLHVVAAHGGRSCLAGSLPL